MTRIASRGHNFHSGGHRTSSGQRWELQVNHEISQNRFCVISNLGDHLTSTLEDAIVKPCYAITRRQSATASVPIFFMGLASPRQ